MLAQTPAQRFARLQFRFSLLPLLGFPRFLTLRLLCFAVRHYSRFTLFRFDAAARTRAADEIPTALSSEYTLQHPAASIVYDPICGAICGDRNKDRKSVV